MAYRYAFVGAVLGLVGLSTLMQLKIEARRSDQLLFKNLVAIAHWIKEVLPPDALIATSDVGIVPYYSGLPTFDIHPEALTDKYIAQNGFSPEYFFERNPDLVMFHNRGVHEMRLRSNVSTLVNDSRFIQAYRLLGVSKLMWYEDLSYRIYIKKDLLLTDEQLARFPRGFGDRCHDDEFSNVSETKCALFDKNG